MCACASTTIVPLIGCIRFVVLHVAGAAGVVDDTRILFGRVFYVGAGLLLASSIVSLGLFDVVTVGLGGLFVRLRRQGS